MRRRYIPTPPPGPPNDDTPLREVRDWLRTQVDEGVYCPCCKQFAKIYPRKLPRASALVMIKLWRRNQGRDYLFVPKMLDTMTGTAAHGGDGTKGQLWGLMEQQPGIRDDGSNRVGWWRLTDLGRDFVQGNTKVPKIAFVYNGNCLRLAGPPWSIRDALGTAFNYDELMGW